MERIELQELEMFENAAGEAHRNGTLEVDAGTLLTIIHSQVTAVALPFVLTEDQFYAFCAVNGDLQIERTAAGEVLIMAPAFSDTGAQNSKLSTQFGVWAERDGTGFVFGPDGGFTLPNGAMRCPDVSWVAKDRLNQLREEDLEKFAQICPDFVLELRSSSDRLKTIQAKMREYMENGARLGWLIDPKARRVYVYPPNAEVECLDDPDSVSGEPVLRGFVLDLRKIWDTRLKTQ